MLMVVCEARPRPLMVSRSSGFRSSLLGTERALSPYVCHRIPMQNAFKITLHPRHCNCLLKSPVMSVRKDTSRRELCKVLWTIEADLKDGQLLYITGDPMVLGCWKPEMAILMSPSTEHANMWKTEIKVPCGTNFKYNYFIKGDKWPSIDLIWRPGPEFSVSVPRPRTQNKKIVLRDSWMTVQTERPPIHSWGSWTEETYLSAELATSVPSGDEHEILSSLRSDSLVLKPFSIKQTVVDESHSIGRDTINVNNNGPDSSKFFERNQPVEEPWLVQSSLFFLEFKDKLESIVSNKESNQSNQDELTKIEFLDKGYHGMGNPEDGTRLSCVEEPISTVILINSSICTMQRIAVLEDGKLVELLLEPVKNNVQCDSVYLGVVTKLVPHMGGAFVNIGISRPSLMDIKHYREPFVFPPFRRKAKRKEVNGSMTSKHKEHPNIHDNQTSSHDDVEVIDGFTEVDYQDNPAQFMHEDFEELETEDDFDVPDILKRNMNGSIVDYGGGEADFEDYVDGIGPVNESLPSEMEGSHDTPLSHHILQDMKDSTDAHPDGDKWAHVRKGTKVIVQVVKEGLGTKGPALTAYPNLRSRFWILSTRCDRIGVSKKISGVERTRLRVIAKTLQPPGFGLTVRTVAAGHSLEELQQDLEGLLSTWKDIMEHAKSAALAADEGVEGAIPAILHRAMGQTLSVAQDYFNEKVNSMVVDSPRTFHEVTSYLQEIAPNLCDRVELFDKRIPIFDKYGIEEEINNMLSKRVPLANGGSLVIEQTEALVSIDVNGGHGMLGQGNSQEKAILDVNLAAAKQIARELRLRDIGGIIVVDFIDMVDDSNKRLVYEETKKAVERDRSMVRVSELSRHGLMEITRKRVRPSVTFMISEPCTCCHATGRVEALETSFSKIEHEICRLLAMSDQKANPQNPKSWPRFVLRVDRFMCNYLTSGKRTRLALLSSSLKVWILLKVARGFTRGAFEVKPFMDGDENNDQNQVAISRLRPTDTGSYLSSTKLTLFPVKKWKTGRK